MSVISIQSQADLNAALAKCVGGEEVDASAVLLTNAGISGLRFPADNPVKLKVRAQAPAGPNGAGSPDGQKIWNGFSMVGCSGLVLVESDFRGVVLDRYSRFGQALLIHDCQDIGIERSRFGDTWQGLWAYLCERLTIADNDFAGVGPFGMQVAHIAGLKVSRNGLSDFNVYLDPTLDPAISEHSDAIMIETAPPWGPGSEWALEGSSDIVIEDNFVLGNPDNKPQGIFIRNAGGDPVKGVFHRVMIRRNDLWGTMWRAISIETDDDQLDIIDNRARCLIEPGRAVPGGTPFEARINVSGDFDPRTLTGNSASAYNRNDLAATSPGVAIVPRVAFAEAQAAFGAWQAARAAGQLPSQTGVAPPPAPAPAPSPPPAPNPAPAPSPAPSGDLRVRVQKARQEVNDLKNGAARAVYALDQLLKGMDA